LSKVFSEGRIISSHPRDYLDGGANFILSLFIFFFMGRTEKLANESLCSLLQGPAKFSILFNNNPVLPLYEMCTVAPLG